MLEEDIENAIERAEMNHERLKDMVHDQYDEIERLKERLTIYESDSDTVIMSKEKWEETRKEIERLKRQIKIKDEWCRGIWMVGANYDGYGDDLKGLRELVDELIDYSNKARTCDDKSVAYVSWEGEKEIKSNILMERIESDK